MEPAGSRQGDYPARGINAETGREHQVSAGTVHGLASSERRPKSDVPRGHATRLSGQW